MNIILRKQLLIIVLCLTPTLGFSQSKEIKIEFLGNCGLYFTDGETNIYTDFPYKSGAHGYMNFDESELDSIKENSIFRGKKYGSWNIEELKKLGESIPNFDIQIFKTKHKWSCKHYSYLITWHDKIIYLSGDAESAETIGTMKNIDWAFVPYWLLLDAKENNIQIDAKMFGVYHLATIQIPSAKENYDTIDNIKPMVEQGEVFYIELNTN